MEKTLDWNQNCHCKHTCQGCQFLLSLSLFSPMSKERIKLYLMTNVLKWLKHSSFQQLPVVTSSTIVRCRSCRTYINPFVSFLDQRRWKCNLCYRVNDGEFFYEFKSNKESVDFMLSSEVYTCIHTNKLFDSSKIHLWHQSLAAFR